MSSIRVQFYHVLNHSLFLTYYFIHCHVIKLLWAVSLGLNFGRAASCLVEWQRNAYSIRLLVNLNAITFKRLYSPRLAVVLLVWIIYFI